MKNLLIINKEVIIKASFWSLVLLILVGCTQNSKKNSEEESIYAEVEVDMAEPLKMNYRIPTPLDMFVVMHSEEAPFVEEALNAPVNKQQYNSSLQQAVNFGIYVTDLAYCSVYGNIQESMVYYNTAKDLASALGLYEGYGEKMAKRIQDNLNNVDSLIDISTDSYHGIINFLNDQGMSDILSLIMVGSWIESSFLATQSVHKFEATHPIIERIADQRFLLENLVEFCESNADSDAVNETLEKLYELQEVYDELYFNADDVLITKEQFVNIVNKVHELRQFFIS